MSPKKRRTRKLPEPDHALTATIRKSRFSYFISSHYVGETTDTIVDDESIIELEAEITKMVPSQPAHLGELIECSLVCARRFRREDSNEHSDRPMLFSLTLRRDQRSFLAYLPADAFWALQSRLEAEVVRHIEVRYLKPTRGVGDLTSLYLC